MTKPVSSLCDHPLNDSMLQSLQSFMFVAAVFSGETNGGAGQWPQAQQARRSKIGSPKYSVTKS